MEKSDCKSSSLRHKANGLAQDVGFREERAMRWNCPGNERNMARESDFLSNPAQANSSAGATDQRAPGGAGSVAQAESSYVCNLSSRGSKCRQNIGLDSAFTPLTLAA